MLSDEIIFGINIIMVTSIIDVYFFVSFLNHLENDIMAELIKVYHSVKFKDNTPLLDYPY